MNIFSKLPFLKSEDEPELSEEEIEAEAKRERIKFHRERVRNGPVTFTSLTNGQIRRAQRRELDRQGRKARRAQLRNYHERQQAIARLRGNLQAVGALSYASPDFTAPAAVQERADRALRKTFGETDTIENALHVYQKAVQS